MKKPVFTVLAVVLAACVSLSVTAQAQNSAQGESNPGLAKGRPHGFMERAAPAAVARALKAQERHNSFLLAIEGVRGTAVSWREDGETVVKVYVDRPGKADAGAPDNAHYKNIPRSVDGVPVVVEAAGPFYALNIPCESRKDGICDSVMEAEASAGVVIPTDWQPRPVPLGVSAGHVDVTAGTLGCRVTSGCHQYALSNAHVFADENSGMVGDEILQPGPYDGGTSPADVIGTLYDMVPIEMGTNPSVKNKIDAAIALVTTSTVSNTTPPEAYGQPRQETVAAAINMDVMKYGRTSKLKYGYVDAINAVVNVDYTAGTARFINQIVIVPTASPNFSRPGDSGSLVVATGGDDDRKPVGLLFASGDGITIANPIDLVLEEFGVVIDGN